MSRSGRRPSAARSILVGLLMVLAWWTSAALLAVEPPSPASSTDPRTLDALGFMVGCWEGTTASGSLVRETHGPPRGGQMLGTGQTVRNGKVRSFEFFRIEATEEGVVYRPSPNGVETVAFRLTETASSSAVFTNPEHDFPQRIAYRSDDGAELVATISHLDGSDPITFRMSSIECDTL